MTDLKKLKEALRTHDEDVRIANNSPVDESLFAAVRDYASRRHELVFSSDQALRLVTELEELRAYRKLLPVESALELVSNLIGVAGAVRRGLASGQLEKVADARRYLWDVPE